VTGSVPVVNIKFVVILIVRIQKLELVRFVSIIASLVINERILADARSIFWRAVDFWLASADSKTCKAQLLSKRLFLPISDLGIQKGTLMKAAATSWALSL
jgi:hypothetical protein